MVWKTQWSFYNARENTSIIVIIDIIVRERIYVFMREISWSVWATRASVVYTFVFLKRERQVVFFWYNIHFLFIYCIILYKKSQMFSQSCCHFVIGELCRIHSEVLIWLQFFQFLCGQKYFHVVRGFCLKVVWWKPTAYGSLGPTWWKKEFVALH